MANFTVCHSFNFQKLIVCIENWQKMMSILVGSWYRNSKNFALPIFAPLPFCNLSLVVWRRHKIRCCTIHWSYIFDHLIFAVSINHELLTTAKISRLSIVSFTQIHWAQVFEVIPYVLNAIQKTFSVVDGTCSL